MQQTQGKVAVFGMVRVCKYPTCTEPAEGDMPCCSSRHGMALNQLRDALTDQDIFSASWRKGVFGANVLGDRYEDMIFVARSGALGI